MALSHRYLPTVFPSPGNGWWPVNAQIITGAIFDHSEKEKQGGKLKLLDPVWQRGKNIKIEETQDCAKHRGRETPRYNYPKATSWAERVMFTMKYPSDQKQFPESARGTWCGYSDTRCLLGHHCHPSPRISRTCRGSPAKFLVRCLQVRWRPMAMRAMLETN